jgi:hypothetical protein
MHWGIAVAYQYIFHTLTQWIGFRPRRMQIGARGRTFQTWEAAEAHEEQVSSRVVANTDLSIAFGARSRRTTERELTN